MASDGRPRAHAVHPRALQRVRAEGGAGPHGQPEALPPPEHPHRLQRRAGARVVLPLLPGRQARVVPGLQLAVSARGLQQHAPGPGDRGFVLPVLCGQADGAAGHGVLRAAQKGAAGQLPAPVPPHRDAHRVVGLRQVHGGRPRHLHRLHQLLRAHRHVLVLPAGRAGPHGPLVEALRHPAAARPVLRRVRPLRPAVLPRLRLPALHAHPDATQLRLLLLPVQGLLRQGVRAEGGAGAAPRQQDQVRLTRSTRRGGSPPWAGLRA